MREGVGRAGGAPGRRRRLDRGRAPQAARPDASVRAVRAYQLLPERVVPTVGHAPADASRSWSGLCLVLGLLTRVAAAVSGAAAAWRSSSASPRSGPAASRSTAAASAAAGPTRTPHAQYPWEIARDVGPAAAVASAWSWRPRTPLAAGQPAAAGRASTERGRPMSKKKSHDHPPRTSAGRLGARREPRRSRSASERRRRRWSSPWSAWSVARADRRRRASSSQPARDTTERRRQRRRPAAAGLRRAGRADRRRRRQVVDLRGLPVPVSAGSSRRPRADQLRAAGADRARCRSSTDRSSSWTGSTTYSARRPTLLRSCWTPSGPTVAKKFHDLLYDNQPSEGSAVPERRPSWSTSRSRPGPTPTAPAAGIEDQRGQPSGSTTAPRPPSDAGVNGTPDGAASTARRSPQRSDSRRASATDLAATAQ